MNIYALSSLLASYVCFPLGILVYQRDPKNKLNRIFMVSCILLGFLAFAEFELRQAPDAVTAQTWIKISAFWPLVIAVYFHFILTFTKSRALKSRVTYFLLYVPAVILSVLALTTGLVSGTPIKEYWGWMYAAPANALVYDISGIWAFLLTILPLILCFWYFYTTEEPIEKQRAKYVLAAIVVPVMVASATKGVLPLMGIKVPDFSITATTIEFIVITYGIYRYNLFSLTPAVAADDIVASMSNVLFLVRNDGTISLANASALNLLEYSAHELVGQPLRKVFPEHEWKKIEKSSALESGIENQEMVFLTKDDKAIPVLVSISVIRDNFGNRLGLVCVGSDLTDHNLAEEARKREVLLKEIHHRVKNNMQIISSLLSLQSGYIVDEKYKGMFKESQNRIKSMALIHEKLYQSKDLEKINFHEYITDMVQELVCSYENSDITLTIEADDIPLGVDTAVPCGLIINELVSNALKHAFPGRKGEIRVGFHAAHGKIQLVIGDNGVGIPENVDFKRTETLGLKLVTILAEDQLEGSIQLNKDGGTEFSIVFEMNEH